jgi:hypothetical protein
MPCKYYFSEIPNNEEGREFVRLMKKYLNKTYKCRCYRYMGLVWITIDTLLE